MRTPHSIVAALGPLMMLLGCGTEPAELTFQLQADRFASSAWSEPVNLGPVVNSSAVDANAGLSPDEHTLYLISNRPGGLGGNDIWMSRRDRKSTRLNSSH